MKLKKLIKDIKNIQVKGLKDREITGICQDSKLAKPQELFIARKGKIFDGTHFIPDVIATGVQCVLTDIYNPFYSTITQIVTPDVDTTALSIAQRFYQFPHKSLFMVGITGTNGKTTTSYLVKHILDSLQRKSGLIGTNGYILGENIIEGQRTTPDGIVSLKLMSQMKKKDLGSCVMEVSSHALVQKRVDFIDFDVAIFTNLTHEHLDYHKTMNAYLQAKKKLFSLLEKSRKTNPCAIFNADDSSASFLQEGVTKKIFTYSIYNPSDVQAEDIRLSTDKTFFTVKYQGQKQLFQVPLIGKFNVYNCLASIAFTLHLGVSLQDISAIISHFSPVSGRMERVFSYKKCPVFIDYAHTPDALENLLQTVCVLKKEKIITVFGCGGERDQDKRKKMAEIAEKYSDIAIVTSDNPRNENPDEIIKQIESGFTQKKYFLEKDRKKAIERALQLANKQDIVVIAGKGHEKFQIFSHKTLPFDDKEVVCALDMGCVYE